MTEYSLRPEDVYKVGLCRPIGETACVNVCVCKHELIWLSEREHFYKSPQRCDTYSTHLGRMGWNGGARGFVCSLTLSNYHFRLYVCVCV